MNPGPLQLHLEAYLALESALGLPLRAREKQLRHFVAFVEASGLVGPIPAQLALDWACATSDRCGISGQAARLSLVRRFLLHLSSVVPGTEVPSPALVARPRRRIPFLFSAGEISDLLQVASALEPQASLRPHTISTILGLLASSGLRSSEALQLTVTDVWLDRDPPQLEIRQSKFHKSRRVPIHETTAHKLRAYADQRCRLHYDGLSDYFFVSERGGRMRYMALYNTFQKLVSGLGIVAKGGSRKPSLHSLRHGFAVDRLRTWYQQGADVRAKLPELSVYLGHLEPAHTYWYLSATPELLGEAARLFSDYAKGGGSHE
jgi:integrase/recombinase XerD